MADDRPDAYERLSIGCWRRRTSASAGAGTGSTRPATRTSPAATTTPAIIKAQRRQVEVPRLRRPLVQRRQAVRSIPDRTTGRRRTGRLARAESLTPQMQELLVATGFLRSAADDTDEKELTTPDILNGVLQRTRRGRGQQPVGPDARLATSATITSTSRSRSKTTTD